MYLALRNIRAFPFPAKTESVSWLQGGEQAVLGQDFMKQSTLKYYL